MAPAQFGKIVQPLLYPRSRLSRQHGQDAVSEAAIRAWGAVQKGSCPALPASIVAFIKRDAPYRAVDLARADYGTYVAKDEKTGRPKRKINGHYSLSGYTDADEEKASYADTLLARADTEVHGVMAKGKLHPEPLQGSSLEALAYQMRWDNLQERIENCDKRTAEYRELLSRADRLAAFLDDVGQIERAQKVMDELRQASDAGHRASGNKSGAVNQGEHDGKS